MSNSKNLKTGRADREHDGHLHMLTTLKMPQLGHFSTDYDEILVVVAKKQAYPKTLKLNVPHMDKVAISIIFATPANGHVNRLDLLFNSIESTFKVQNSKF